MGESPASDYYIPPHSYLLIRATSVAISACDGWGNIGKGTPTSLHLANEGNRSNRWE